MSLLSLASAFIALSAPQAVSLNVNAKTGEAITGERQFRVTVQAKNPVTQVEFYVGDDLRDNDTSTPYEFRLDSLAEEDGNLKLRFKAYTNAGELGEKIVMVRIDNGVGKGADFHIQQGLDHLADSKFDLAITSGRIALKADPKSSKARLVMARANLGLRDMAKAQKFAEDAVAEDPNNAEALELLSVINLRRAFGTVNRGGDRMETVNSIREALKSAIESRRKSLDLTVDRMPQPTDATLIPYADAALRAGRYSLAINVLRPAFEKDNRRNDVGNRLGYALLRSDRIAEGLQTILNLKKYGALDAYGYALLAVLQSQAGDEVAADESVREALLNDPDDLGVRTAQTYLALKRNRSAALAKLAGDLAKDQGQRTESAYYLSAVANAQRQFDVAQRQYERAVLAEPINADMYVEEGNRSLSIVLNNRPEKADRDHLLASARAMYETALVARPESDDALIGLALVALNEGKPADAVKFAEAAVKAAPTSAGAQYGLAAAYTGLAKAHTAAAKGAPSAEATRYVAAAQVANRKAGQLDRKNLEGREIPDVTAVWRYLASAGRNAVISAPR